MPENSLKQKALYNIEAADLLVDKGYFDASVHCSYYGCLQLMKLTLKKIGNIDFEVQFKESKATNSGGSHVYYLSKFKDLFPKGRFKEDVDKHTNEIKKLKVLRVKADYDPENVDPIKCRTAVSTARDFSIFVIKEIKI
jgi:hypothetical protein